MIGFVFGWQHVDWPAVERARGRRYGFGRTAWTGRPAIYDRLQPLGACYPDEPAALRPSHTVNRPLRQLVAIMQHRFDEVVRMPAIEGAALRLAAATQLARRIEADPALGAKAAELRRICGWAEDQLERATCARALQTLASRYPARLAKVTATRLRRLHQQCQRRALELLARDGAPASAPPAAALAAQTRVELLKATLLPFPYLRHYEMITAGELRLLAPAAARPRELRERAAAWAPAEPGARAARWPIRDLGAVTVVFCGGGALPLSGLMLHALTGAAVVLVERAAAAAEQARRLLRQLERLAVIEPGRLDVVEADGATLAVRRPGAGSAAPAIEGDVVVLASLVDAGVKQQMMSRLLADPDGPAVLLVRSACGLTALLGYEPAPPGAAGPGGWQHRGEAVPAPCAAWPGRPEAALPLVVATDPDVLNTTALLTRPAPTFEAWPAAR
jgi:hypothetical protein